MEKRIPKRTYRNIMNSLGGGTVPREGLGYITVGREKEIDSLLRDTAIIQDILKYDYGINQVETDSVDRPEGEGGLTDDAIQQIVDSLDDKYFAEIPFETDDSADYTGPEFISPITGIPEDILLPAETEAEAAAE